MKFHPGWNQRSQSRVRLNYSIDADLLFAGPNKSEFDAKIVALNDEVQDFNERLSEVDAKISGMLGEISLKSAERASNYEVSS